VKGADLRARDVRRDQLGARPAAMAELGDTWSGELCSLRVHPGTFLPRIRDSRRANPRGVRTRGVCEPVQLALARPCSRGDRPPDPPIGIGRGRLRGDTAESVDIWAEALLESHHRESRGLQRGCLVTASWWASTPGFLTPFEQRLVSRRPRVAQRVQLRHAIRQSTVRETVWA